VSPSPRVTVRAITQNVATPSVTQLVPLVTVAPFDAIAALAAVATTTATAAANKIILVRRELGRDRQPGLHRVGSDAGRGASDLRVRLDRRL